MITTIILIDQNLRVIDSFQTDEDGKATHVMKRSGTVHSMLTLNENGVQWRSAIEESDDIDNRDFVRLDNLNMQRGQLLLWGKV